MPTFRRRILLEALKFYDLAIMVFAFALSAVLALGVGRVVSFSDFFSMRFSVGNFLLFIGLLVLWHNIFSSLGLYGSHRFASRLSEAWDVVKATFLSSLIMAAAALLFHIKMASPRVLLVFFAISTTLLVVSRLSLKALLSTTRRHGRNLRNVLIVGTNQRALEFAERLETRLDLGCRVIGFVDKEWGGSEEFRKSGHTLACQLDELPEFLRNNVVDEVAITLPIRSFHDDASQIAALCEKQGIMLRMPSNIFDLKMSRSRADELEGHALITHYTGELDGWPFVAKRVFDFTIALIALLAVSPVLLLAAVLIKLTSPGPIFFLQKRIGQNKRKFTIFKFRTMAVDAEARMQQMQHLNEVSGPVFKIKHDPRITPVGSFLRKTSIDELPQLFNVLKGDMSLVGPRPLPIRDYEGFSEDWHRRRFSVRPGITCLWQVMGRSSIPFEKWMELDMQYIDRWSLWLDLKILAQTIPAVLRGFGAA